MSARDKRERSGMGRCEEISRWSSGGRVRNWGMINFCTAGLVICREGEGGKEGLAIVGLPYYYNSFMVWVIIA